MKEWRVKDFIGSHMVTADAMRIEAGVLMFYVSDPYLFDHPFLAYSRADWRRVEQVTP
jgi:hypothetical protein